MPPRMYSDGESDNEGRSNSPATDAHRAAAEVVRLALFHEYRRAPLKRQTIKSVIPESTNITAVFARAQQMLAATFGMQLVELRARHKGDVADERAEQAAAAATQAPTQAQATQGATQTQASRKGKGRAREGEEEDDDEEADAEGEPSARAKGKKRAKTNSYVLRNILPPKIVASMATPKPLPVFEEREDNYLYDEAYMQDNQKDSGALIPWEKTDPGSSIELLGIRTVILCLVLTLGRSADDLKLMSLLRRFGLRRETVLLFGSPDSHHPLMTLEKYMDHLAKQNYLEKIKVPNPSAPEGLSVEWRWGSRETEFSEEAALAFLERIFLNPDSSGEDSNSDDDGGPRRRGQRRQRTEQEKRARFERKRKQLREDVERAAGGALVGEL